MKSFTAMLLALLSLPAFAVGEMAKTLPGAEAVSTLPRVGVGAAEVLSMLGGLAVVLVCLFGLASLLRRARLGTSPAQAGVTVVAQLPLNMKEKLLVVQVDGERLLLGCTPGCIRTLHRWQAEAPAADATPASFASVMGAAFKNVSRGDNTP